MRVRLRVWLRRRRCLTRLSRRRQARAPREAGHRQRFARARHRSSITGIEDTFIRGYRQLALETPARKRDAMLRTLDVVLSALFLLVSLPASLPIALIVLVTSGRPVLYRGERVGRG